MHRLMMWAGAIGVALVTSTAAFAQVPPDPNNPNEAVPEKATYLPYGAPITLATAQKVAAAALAESTKRGWPMCVSVVGPTGDLVYFAKMDDCQFASIEISQHKARTAARFRRPTLVFERLLGKGDYFAYLTTLDGVSASRGGNPIVVEGKIIGAIGVSGGAGSQDDTISQFGANSLKQD
jgi:glc operon protein GlcG